MTEQGLFGTRSVSLGILSGFGYNSMECFVRLTDHPSGLVYKVLMLLSVQVHRNVPLEVTDLPVGTSHTRVSY